MNTRNNIHILFILRILFPFIWMKAQESAFVKVWENDADGVYDTL